MGQKATRRRDIHELFCSALVRARTPHAQVIQPPPEKRRKTGGNPYMTFQNRRMEAAKQIAAAADLTPAGSRTQEARRRVINEAKAAWAGMPDADRATHLQAYRDSQMEKRKHEARASQMGMGAGAAGDSFDEAFSHSSSWGMGTANCAVHPHMVQVAFRDGQRLPTYEQVFDPTAFLVSDKYPDDGLLGWAMELDGCPCLATTICQRAPDFAGIRRVTQSLHALAQHLGPAATRSCDVLVMLEGSDVLVPVGGQTKCRLFGLLSDGNFSPVFLTFTVCEVLEDHEIARDDLVRSGCACLRRAAA